MIQIPLKAEAITGHLNGVSLAGQRWPVMECCLGSSVTFEGIRTSIAKMTISLRFSRGKGCSDSLPPPPPPPSGSAHIEHGLLQMQ